MMKFRAGLSAVLAGMLCGPVTAIASTMATPDAGTSQEAGLLLKNFSVGFIRPAMRFDGQVSQITGDNQTTGNRRLLGEGDRIYLDVANPQDLAPGDKVTLYRQVKKVFHPARGTYLGDLTLTVGLAKVLRVTGNKVTIKVEHSYGAIYPGDGAVRQTASPQPPPASSGHALPEGTGMIVELPPGQTLIGQGVVVYIDWGRNDGLKIGDRLDVVRESPDIPLQLIGELQVVAVEDATASARITKSKAPLLRGDRFTAKSTLREEPSAEASAQGRKDALFEEMAAPPKTAEAVQEAHAAPSSRDIEDELARLTKQVKFDPGVASATDASRPILNKIKALLMEVPDRRIVVEGHTDGQKIGPSLKELFHSNQELSRARAAAIAGVLSEEGGINSRNITIVGFADNKPVATNSTEAGRSQNRRIGITLLPNEPPPASQPPTAAMPETREPSPPAPEPLAPEPLAPEPLAPEPTTAVPTPPTP